MKLYYKAVSKEGRTLEGVVEAKSESEAAVYLRNKEFVPITIKKQSEGNPLASISFLSSKIKANDVVFFTRQLSSMISSGLTLLKALEILKSQISNKAMLEVVENVTTDIKEGMSFSSSAAKHPGAFSSVYIALLKASESSGLLDKVLLRLAETLEKKQKLKGTIKSALMYPAIVVTLMIAVVFVMMIFVIPQLSSLYDNLKIELPLPTQILVGVSRFTVNFWPVVLGIWVFSIFMYRRWGKTETGKFMIDKFSLKVPVFGGIVRKSILVEFARTLGLLLGSGSLVVDSLSQTADIAGNVHYRDAILDVSKKVEKGVTIGDAMSSSVLFPPVLVQLVKIGEQTGKLDETLLKSSEYFEGEVNQSVKNLTTAMEPFIMVALGIGVAFLIISVITPIYNLTSSMQQ